jgi:hypothetical protein
MVLNSSQQIYLLERNVQTFEISSPIQAFHFATFLLRLRDNQEQLKKQVEEKLNDNLDSKRLAEWTKSAQIAEFEATQAEITLAAGMNTTAIPAVVLRTQIRLDRCGCPLRLSSDTFDGSFLALVGYIVFLYIRVRSIHRILLIAGVHHKLAAARMEMVVTLLL